MSKLSIACVQTERLELPREKLPALNTLSTRPRTCNCLKCKPGLYFHHHRHQLEPTILQPGEHDCWFLAVRAVASFKTRPLGFSQLHALELWKEGRSRMPASYHVPIGNDKDQIRRALDLVRMTVGAAIWLFNELFFLNSLGGDVLMPRVGCLVTTGNKPPSEILQQKGLTVIHPESANIDLYLSHPHHSFHADRRLNLIKLIETTLHEMCHAFLGRYSCYKGGSCGTNACLSLCKTNYGATGHGRSWQLLARAIETKLPKLIPGLRVRLGRREMAMLEIDNRGYWPSVSVLDHLAGSEAMSQEERQLPRNCQRTLSASILLLCPRYRLPALSYTRNLC